MKKQLLLFWAVLCAAPMFAPDEPVNKAFEEQMKKRAEERARLERNPDNFKTKVIYSDEEIDSRLAHYDISTEEQLLDFTKKCVVQTLLPIYSKTQRNVEMELSACSDFVSLKKYCSDLCDDFNCRAELRESLIDTIDVHLAVLKRIDARNVSSSSSSSSPRSSSSSSSSSNPAPGSPDRGVVGPEPSAPQEHSDPETPEITEQRFLQKYKIHLGLTAMGTVVVGSFAYAWNNYSKACAKKSRKTGKPVKKR